MASSFLAEGRDAFDRGDAAASRAAFEAALAREESGEALEGLARALYLAVDYPGSIEAHERAFAAYRDEHDALGAAIGVLLCRRPRHARPSAWLTAGISFALYVALVWVLGPLLAPTKDTGVAWLAFWLFAVGACSGALYPLGLALLGERTPPQGMSRAGAWFLASNCLGSVTGPVVAGKAMDLFGKEAMFVAGGAAIVVVFAGWAISAFCCRNTTPEAVEEPVTVRAAA